MAKIDQIYHHILYYIMDTGYEYEDPHRKGVKRTEIPSTILRYDFDDGFPILTTKKMAFNQIVAELLWFLRGDSSPKFLLDNNCNIWNKDAYKFHGGNSTFKDINEFVDAVKEEWISGHLGKIYPVQWRGTGKKVDQIARLITNMKEKPMATDHIVNSWVADDLEDMALPPCHYSFQVIMKPIYSYEHSDLKVDNTSFETEITPKYGFYIQWNQRSVDTFLGLPYNITSYALLAKILEKLTGHKALGIIGNLNKVHIYDNQYEAVEEQLSRDYSKYEAPELLFMTHIQPLIDSFNQDNINLDELIHSFRVKDFILDKYESYPAITGIKMLERNV